MKLVEVRFGDRKVVQRLDTLNRRVDHIRVVDRIAWFPVAR